MTASNEAEQQSQDLGGLASLIPQLAVEMTAAGVKHQVIDGSMLSADISGFTALSEKLADRGKAGRSIRQNRGRKSGRNPRRSRG